MSTSICTRECPYKEKCPTQNPVYFANASINLLNADIGRTIIEAAGEDARIWALGEPGNQTICICQPEEKEETPRIDTRRKIPLLIADQPLREYL